MTKFMNNIHIWSLQSFSQDYNHASHITYKVFVNSVDFDRQIFEKLFMPPILFTRELLKGNIFLIFRFVGDRCLASRSLNRATSTERLLTEAYFLYVPSILLC